MRKESFQYPETAKVFDLLEETSRRSSVSRAQAFEDFLLMSVAALSGGRMEEQYLQTVAKHTSGKHGKRGCDSIAKMFGELVGAMEQDTNDQMRDIIGDLFEGAISYGEHGQFLTPMPVCEMMARLTIGKQAPTTPEESPDDKPEAEIDVDSAHAEVEATSEIFRPKRIHDPCCGSGRMLLAAAMINRHWEFVGQDVDRRCVQMCALNLAFRGLYGYVIHGNSLAMETKLVYRTGFDGRGFISEIPFANCPGTVKEQVKSELNPTTGTDTATATAEETRSQTQLRLF